MANDHSPKKVGVYGAGGAAGMNWTWIIIGLIVLALILYFVLS